MDKDRKMKVRTPFKEIKVNYYIVTHFHKLNFWGADLQKLHLQFLKNKGLVKISDIWLCLFQKVLLPVHYHFIEHIFEGKNLTGLGEKTYEYLMNIILSLQ